MVAVGGHTGQNHALDDIHTYKAYDEFQLLVPLMHGSITSRLLHLQPRRRHDCRV